MGRGGEGAFFRSVFGELVEAGSVGVASVLAI